MVELALGFQPLLGGKKILNEHQFILTNYHHDMWPCWYLNSNNAGVVFKISHCLDQHLLNGRLACFQSPSFLSVVHHWPKLRFRTRIAYAPPDGNDTGANKRKPYAASVQTCCSVLAVPSLHRVVVVSTFGTMYGPSCLIHWNSSSSICVLSVGLCQPTKGPLPQDRELYLAIGEQINSTSTKKME